MCEYVRACWYVCMYVCLYICAFDPSDFLHVDVDYFQKSAKTDKIGHYAKSLNYQLFTLFSLGETKITLTSFVPPLQVTSLNTVDVFRELEIKGVFHRLGNS